MSNTNLAYHNVRSPASILSSLNIARYRDWLRVNFTQPSFSLGQAGSTVARLLVMAMILLLTLSAQAQRQTAAFHIIQPGETLGLIARQYGLAIQDLAAANGISDAHIIHSWQELMIPTGENPPVAASGKTHVVRRGESLGSIAETYGVAVFDLMTLNNVYGWVYPGDELALPATASEPAPVASSVDDTPSENAHIVWHGETLSSIAEAYGLSLRDLRAANNIWSGHIYVGQALEIPGNGAPAVERESASEPTTSAPAPAAENVSAPVEASGIIHKVQIGESLSAIAEAYGVSLANLKALNNLSRSVIYTDEELEIPAGGLPQDSMQSQPAPQIQTSAEPSSPLPNPAPARNPGSHTVQRGETLFRIALRYGLSVDSLMSINGIKDPTRIHAGNQLRLKPSPASAQPAASNTAASPAPASASSPAPASAPPPHHSDHGRYIVRRGDFLTQLGIDLNTSWIALAKLNALADPNNLHVGSTLLIPKREDVERYDPEYAAWKWFDMIGNQPGPRIGHGREIVIVLGTQSAYAYENGVLQKAARVSAGKKATPTIQGDHKIWLKRRSQTMSGPGYSLDNVEWVMYFYKDYAIHGAWWHMNFGTPMSHGCVNLTNADAQWFFNFASIGTPVYVRS